MSKTEVSTEEKLQIILAGLKAAKTKEERTIVMNELKKHPHLFAAFLKVCQILYVFYSLFLVNTKWAILKPIIINENKFSNKTSTFQTIQKNHFSIIYIKKKNPAIVKFSIFVRIQI